MSTVTLPPPNALQLEGGATPYRMTVAKYEELVRLGAFEPGDRIELINGILVAKMTVGTAHTYATTKLALLLWSLCGRTHTVFTQQPLLLAGSVPEPDVFVAAGAVENYRAAKPTPADTPLVIEVAESTLPFDLGSKMRLYAAAGVPEYWVVDLVNGVVHVHTRPRGGKSPGYKSVLPRGRGDALPVTLGGVTVGTLSVKEFLP